MKERCVCGGSNFGKAAFILLALFLSGCGRDESGKLTFQSGCTRGERVESFFTEAEDNADSLRKENIQYPLIATPSDARWITLAIASEGNYCIFDGEKYGFITETGEEITPCIYDIAYPFSEGLACVCKDGRYGYIDPEGETVIPFDYDRATPFSEGLAYFAAGDTYGFMDKTGNPAFYFECDSVSSFQDGLAYFSIDGRYGYIDSNGQIAIEPVFDDADYFQDGLAKIMKEGRYGVINREGALIVAAEYDRINIEDSFIMAQSEGRYTCFDKMGKALLGQSNDLDDITINGEFIYFKKEGKEGLSDKKGNMLIEPLYDWISSQVPGQDLLMVREGELYGVADLQGEIMIPVVYTRIYYDRYADSIEGGMLILTDAEGNMECVDADDLSEKIPCSYDSIDWLDKDRAIVSLDGLSGVIDRTGNLIEPIEYDMIRGFTDGALWMKKGTKTWFYNSRGDAVEDIDDYEDISIKENYYQIKKDGKYGFLNKQGEEIIPPVYGYISDYKVYGCFESFYIATDYSGENHDSIIKLGEPGQIDISGALLQNEITPRIGLYQEFARAGSISINDDHIQTVNQEDLGEYRKTYKLYDLDHSGEPILFFKAEPYEYNNFPMSYSGFYAIRDDQLVELATGYECGGSMRGDYVCLWYDRETARVFPGKNGVWGGFGGYAYDGTVYDEKGGEIVCIASFDRVCQVISNYSDEELLEHAELFYDEEGRPYTKETIMQEESGSAQKFSVNGVQTTIEAYQEVADRYIRL